MPISAFSINEAQVPLIVRVPFLLIQLGFRVYGLGLRV